MKESAIAALLSNLACNRAMAEKVWDGGLREKLMIEKAESVRADAERASRAFYKKMF